MLSAIRKKATIKYFLLVVSAFLPLSFLPSLVSGATYQDVQDFIASYPVLPLGCELVTRQSTNADGQDVYTVWKVCRTGESSRDTYYLDGSQSGGYNDDGDMYYRRCMLCEDGIPLCDGSGGYTTQGAVYWTGTALYSCHKKKQTIVYYCDDPSKVDVINEQLDPYWSCMGERLAANCHQYHSETDCTKTEEKLKEFVIDPCEGLGPCCGDPCCEDECCDEGG